MVVDNKPLDISDIPRKMRVMETHRYPIQDAEITNAKKQ
jgi:hypothetical protein